MNTSRRNSQIAIRPLQESNADAFYQAVNRSKTSLHYWMPWCKPDYALKNAQQWVRFAAHACQAEIEFHLGIFDAQTGELIGGVGINQINTAYQIGNLGYWVAGHRRGEHVARQAARMMVEIGFCELGLQRIEIIIHTENPASQKVAQSIGAQFEVLARNRLIFQGKTHNAQVYSLIPDDLPGLIQR